MSIPLLALFRHPTVRGMADTLREKDWPLTPRLVTSIQSRGAGPPLFCIASPEVNTVGYTLLARYLGEDRPIYVVQAPPARDEVRRLDPQDLLELAGPYDEAISAIAPAGPLYLLGMCSGAHVAVEMARRLRDAGRDVPYVGLVNTWAFYTRSRLYRLERLRLRSRYYLSRVVRILRVEPGRSLTTLRGRLGRLVGAPGRGNSDGAGPPGAPRGGRSLRTKPNPWLDEVGWARSGVEVRRFAGTITVYRIRRQQVGRIRDRAMGWGRFAERTEVEILPGTDHHAILREPHVRELARRVRETLVELQTEVRSLS
jgi:thioesterase domain-containing protein